MYLSEVGQALVADFIFAEVGREQIRPLLSAEAL